jgi:phenylpropionate dioxygenase-like ring-hydroxylating dioxygenase large terminal subunit
MSVLDAPEKIKPGARDLSGVAYGRGSQHPDELLVGVKAGTPAGEWLRRYWQPIALSSKVTNRPRKVKLLGEELIIFRNGKGQVGLLYPRCMHRGTSLYYGRVEEQGIRCCYHGWLFDVEGNCLEQPCEPQGGLRRDAARQPWYPTEERYGIVFAYMGPPDRMPVLPRYDILEDLGEGEFVHAWGGDGSIAYVDTDVKVDSAPYHWTHAFDNVMDTYHASILHAWFTDEDVRAYKDEPKYTPRVYPTLPKISWERRGLGTVALVHSDLGDGHTVDRTNYAILPNIFMISGAGPDPSAANPTVRGSHVTWYVAADDEELVIFNVSKVVSNQASHGSSSKAIGHYAMPMSPDGRGWSKLTEDEHQDYPGDFEAQIGQGCTTLHSEEHLTQSDVGVAMLRRLMKEQIKAVQDGKDPLGVKFDEDDATVEVLSGAVFS